MDDSRGPRLNVHELRRAAEEDRRRMLQNAAAFVFVVVLVCFGAWVIDRLAAYNHNLECLSSRHRQCG